MFGDYFRNLTTNQKIMLGVAVFLVVCVIVYLIYKYMFKAAKNFIQNFILTKKEKFERITINVKSSCDKSQFYNGTSCSNLPPNTVRTKRGLNNADVLKYCISNTGEQINDYECKQPTSNNVPTPTVTNTSMPTDRTLSASNYNSATNGQITTVSITTNSIGPALVGGNNEQPTNSTIPFQLGFTYNTSSPNAIKVDDFTSLPSGTTYQDKVYYSYGVPSLDTTGKVFGQINYYIPIKRINYYLPQNNISTLPSNCLSGYSTPGQASCSTDSNEGVFNADINNAKYISMLASQNDTRLKAVVAKLLSDQNINLFRIPSAEFDVTNIQSYLGIMNNASFGYSKPQTSSVYYLTVTSVPYNCGENNTYRTVTTEPCQGSKSVTSVIYSDGSDDVISASSVNLTRNKTIGANVVQGTFSNICKWTGPSLSSYQNGKWFIIGEDGSCSAKNCELDGTTISKPYNGVNKPFVFVQNSTIFSSFDAGQDIYLPEDLTSAGDPAKTPSTYVLSTEWNITVKTQPDLLGQWCSNSGLITTAIAAYEGDTKWQIDPFTDTITWYRGSNRVRVTRKIYQKYSVTDPTTWGVYYTTNNNTQPTIFVSGSSQPSSFQSVFIGAPRVTPANNLSPIAVPIFQITGIQNDTYDASKSERISPLQVERNIWVGISSEQIYDTDPITRIKTVKQRIADLFRTLAAFNPFGTKIISGITGIDFVSSSATLSELKWGFAINETRTSVPLDFNRFTYSIPSTAVSTSSGQGTANLSNGSARTYFIDRSSARIEWVTNASATLDLSFSSTNSLTTPTNTVPVLFEPILDADGFAIFANIASYDYSNPAWNNRDIYRFQNGSFVKQTQTNSLLATSRRWSSLDVNNTLNRRVISVATDGSIIFSNNGGASWQDISPSSTSNIKITLPSITVSGQQNPVSASTKFTKVMFGNKTLSDGASQDIYFSTTYESIKLVQTYTKTTSSSGIVSGTLVSYTQTDTNTSSTQTPPVTTVINSTTPDFATLNSLITSANGTKVVETIQSLGGYIYRAVLNFSSTSPFTISQITNLVQLPNHINTNGRYDIQDFVVKRTAVASVVDKTFISAAEYNGTIYKWSINDNNTITPIPYTTPFGFLGGKWISIDMNDDVTVSISGVATTLPAGKYQVACSNFESTSISSLSDNDGRIIYSEDFGNTWRDIVLPRRGTSVQPTPVSPIVDPSASIDQKIAAKFNYNPYNFTSVIFAGNPTARDFIISTYGPYRQPMLGNVLGQDNSYVNHTSSIDTTTAFPGILRIQTYPQ